MMKKFRKYSLFVKPFNCGKSNYTAIGAENAMVISADFRRFYLVNSL